MKHIRKVFFCVLVTFFIWIGINTYDRLTDGFSIHQMSSSLPSCPQFDLPLTLEKKEELKALLDQKFYYVGKGAQFYVFGSEDGEYVIKFLKHKHLRPFTWLNGIPMPEKLRAVCDAKIMRRKERVERLFSSCKLAYEKMPEETGLFFIHLNRIPTLETSITLVDKIGFKHSINVDDYEYFLQKKGISIKEVFANSDANDISKRVQQLVDLVLARCNKGICDQDHAFVQNVVFTLDGEKAIFVDIGQFYEDPSMLKNEEQNRDLSSRLNSLSLWMEQNFPQFVPLIKEEV